MLGGKRATGKCRVDKKGNVKEEARIRMAWEERGSKSRRMENRKGVVHRRFERAHHFYREEEKEEEEKEEKVEVEEEETLPLFDVAGETKNGG